MERIAKVEQEYAECEQERLVDCPLRTTKKEIAEKNQKGESATLVRIIKPDGVVQQYTENPRE
jgi:hypothetical protein